jgi:hypothetical protein
MINTEASAVIGPTPGCVISRIASGSFAVRISTAGIMRVTDGVERHDAEALSAMEN